MKTIKIEQTLHRPKILLDFENSYVCFQGKSIVSNVDEFYSPILEWLKEFTSDFSRTLVFDFKLEYFNTASLKEILQILLLLKNAENNGSDITFNWFFYDDDDDMKEIADEAKLLSQLEINYQIME